MTLRGDVARAVGCIECEETGEAVTHWSVEGTPTFGPCPVCGRAFDVVRARMLTLAKSWESMAGPANSVYEQCARDLRGVL